MSVRRFPGIKTLGGIVFWTDLANQDGWRVQSNTFPGFSVALKPFRLLDPHDHLWASADAADELAAVLPEFVAEFSKRHPLVDKDDILKALGALAAAVLGLVVKEGFRR